MSTLKAEVPRKLAPLLKPMRYKGAYGGRGGAKSHFFAEEMILRCVEGPVRCVCIREVQNSIKDSVRQLLTDKIAKLHLESEFEVLDNEIRGPGGSLIIFKGMQSYNADNIKSLEAYDIAWVEEAQTLSQHSLDMLRPTIRKEGSELWFSWNPRYKTDPVDIFFRKQRRDNALAISVNWRDNPWFPAVLQKEMNDDYAEDEDKAEHIWGGAYGFSKGSILGKWINKARRDGRVGSVQFDAYGAPLEISSDIGFHDTATWWFWQRKIGGYSVLGHLGASGMDADDWCVEIDDYMEKLGIPVSALGKIWLPHDARAKTFQSKHTTVERFITHYEMRRVGVVPMSRKSDQISAARLVIDSAEFDAKECSDGIDGLEAWEFEFNEETQEFSREPLHNWACFVAGTLVDAEHGTRPIETLLQGDMVKTPVGLRRVDAVYVYEAPEQISITLADGRAVMCTCNHKFFTQRGLVPADALSYDDVLCTGDEKLWPLISLISKGVGITSIHQAITHLGQPESSGSQGSAIGGFIRKYGPKRMARNLRAMRSTIRTSTLATTPSTILSCSPSPSTRDCMVLPVAGSLQAGTKPRLATPSIPVSRPSSGKPIEAQSWSTLWLSWWLHGKLPKSGTPQTPAENGTASTANWHGRSANLSTRVARCVVRHLLRIGLGQNSAGRIVELKRFDGVRLVYDLNVNNDHCFIANGILTSNSHHGDGFAYGAQVMQGLAPVRTTDEPRHTEVGPGNTLTLQDAWGTRRTTGERI